MVLYSREADHDVGFADGLKIHRQLTLGLFVIHLVDLSWVVLDSLCQSIVKRQAFSLPGHNLLGLQWFYIDAPCGQFATAIRRVH